MLLENMLDSRHDILRLALRELNWLVRALEHLSIFCKLWYRCKLICIQTLRFRNGRGSSCCSAICGNSSIACRGKQRRGLARARGSGALSFLARLLFADAGNRGDLERLLGSGAIRDIRHELRLERRKGESRLCRPRGQ